MIACSDLEIRVGYRPLFRNLSFAVPSQKSLAILGPNGCGKTTLLRCLAGLVRPAHGVVTLNQHQLWPHKSTPSFANKIYYISAQPALYLDQTVVRQLEFMCNAFGLVPSLNDLLAALDRVGLNPSRANQVVRSLSTGQKRRLTLAVLPLVKPNIVLADEPTNGLDSEGTATATALFNTCVNAGGCLVLATHDNQLASACSAQIQLQERL